MITDTYYYNISTEGTKMLAKPLYISKSLSTLTLEYFPKNWAKLTILDDRWNQ